MSKLGLFALVGAKIMQVRRRTWVLLGLGLLALFGLSIWAAIALMGWFFAQVQGWGAAAPEVARDALATVEQQVEQVAPGAREKIAEFVPVLKPAENPWREVSGTDIAPVPRYPGLVRTHWHREGRQVTVHYEGRAAFPAVLDHYLRGFAAMGYAHELLSASPAAESHVWTQGKQRYHANILAKPKGEIAVKIETRLE